MRRIPVDTLIKLNWEFESSLDLPALVWLAMGDVPCSLDAFVDLGALDTTARCRLPRFGGPWLAALVAACAQLTALHLTGGSHVDSAALLSLAGCDRLTSAGVAALAG